MKKFKGALVRIEHHVVTVEVEAETEAEATEKMWTMINDGIKGEDGEFYPVDWDSGEVVHAEEFVQDEEEVTDGTDS